MKKILLILILISVFGCAKSTEIAVNAEKNIHAYLGAFRIQLRARCDNNKVLAVPCETVRKGWTELLEVAIKYDEVLLAEKIDKQILVEFQTEIQEFITLVQSTELKDLTPSLVALQGQVK